MELKTHRTLQPSQVATMNETAEQACQRAVELIGKADALLIGAGAGMGVDSGMPDFRGTEGFWKVYPMLTGRTFHEMANPKWFRSDPAFAWGFYGHRLDLYRRTIPHEGYAILHRWAERAPAGYFVYTSNVDGHFQKAGFPQERVVECHGSIHLLQCQRACQPELWQAEGLELNVDPDTLRARAELPVCPRCGHTARPNILMFEDDAWIESYSAEQVQRFRAWRHEIRDKFVVAIELGAGTAISTVRYRCQDASQLIRINPHDAAVEPGGVAIKLGALEALQSIDRLL